MKKDIENQIVNAFEHLTVQMFQDGINQQVKGVAVIKTHQSLPFAIVPVERDPKNEKEFQEKLARFYAA